MQFCKKWKLLTYGDLHKYDNEFTFYSARLNIYSRTDYFFVFSRDLHKVKECTIEQSYLSDHNLDINSKTTLWRLGLLKRNTFKTEMAKKLKTYFRTL